MMIRSHIVTAWRSLARHRSFTVITVTGLALGMGACLLILTFVWDQARYDDFHARADRIYRILSDQSAPRSDVDHLAASPAPLADELSDGPIMRVFSDFAGVIGLMAALAILVSCLGLLGMAAYATETRVREVGLRKALGASRAGVVFLLSRSFLGLILAGAAFALPLAWLSNRAWLELFASRVGLSPWIFLGATLLTVLLALAATATQTLRAASVNPVESLRHE
jgi:putative ABC transport system permease protein